MIFDIIFILYMVLPPVVAVFFALRILNKTHYKMGFSIYHILLSVLLISIGVSGKVFIVKEFDEPLIKYTFLFTLLLGSGLLYPAIRGFIKIFKVKPGILTKFLVFLPLIISGALLMGYYKRSFSLSITIIIEGISLFFITLPFILSFYVEDKYIERRNYFNLILCFFYFVPLFLRDLPFIYILPFSLLTVFVIFRFPVERCLTLKLKEGLLFTHRYFSERKLRIFKSLFVLVLIFSLSGILGNFYISKIVHSVRERDIKNSQEILDSYKGQFLSKMETLINDLKYRLWSSESPDINELKRVYGNGMEIVNSVMFYKKDGSLLLYFPSLDIKSNRVSKEVIERVRKGEFVYSKPAKNIYDSYSMIIYAPYFEKKEVFGDERFSGILSVSIDFKGLIDDFVKKGYIDIETTLVIYGDDGKVYWSLDKSLVSESLYEFKKSRDFLSLESPIYKEMKLNLGVYKSKEAVLKDTDLFVKTIVLFVIILTLGNLLLGFTFINEERKYSEEMERELEDRFKDIVQYRNSLFILNQKLEKIIKVISNINPRKGIFEILRNLINLSKNTLKDIDAGILFMKKGDLFKPVFSFGINYKYIKNISFPPDALYLLDLKEFETFRGDIVDFLLTLGIEDGALDSSSRIVLKEFCNSLIFKGVFEGEIVCLCILLSRSKAFLDNENLKLSNFLSKLIQYFIELNRYFEITKTNEIRERILIKVLSLFSLDKSIFDILRESYEIVNEAFGGLLVSLGYGIPKEDMIDVTVVYEGEIQMYSLPKDVGIMGRSFRKGSVEIEPDVSKDPDYYKIRDDVKSEVFIPIFTKNEITGVLELAFNRKKVVSDKDRVFFEEIGRTLNLILNNINLFNKLKEAYLETIFALTKTIELKDPYTGGHSERVAFISLLIADKINLSRDRKEKLVYAALLHDIGKIAVKGTILNKSGKLSDGEYEEVKKHTILGAAVLKGISYLKGVDDIVRHHHERFDGKGYPEGLKDGDIPLLSRIIAIADAFDAMISDRPTEKPLVLNMQ